VVLRPTGGSRLRGAPPSSATDRGSQTIELALLLPALALLVAGVLLAGLAATELVLAQAVARDAARAAAVDGDAAARAAAQEVAGRRELRITTSPPPGARRAGSHVTVDVELRSAALARVGVEAWLPARAVMVVEAP
jgi:Flp pilus assembly protein TadG